MADQDIDRDLEVIEATLQSNSLTDVVTPTPSILDSPAESLDGDCDLESDEESINITIVNQDQEPQIRDQQTEPPIPAGSIDKHSDGQNKQFLPRLNGGARKRLRHRLAIFEKKATKAFWNLAVSSWKGYRLYQSSRT